MIVLIEKNIGIDNVMDLSSIYSNHVKFGYTACFSWFYHGGLQANVSLVFFDNSNKSYRKENLKISPRGGHDKLSLFIFVEIFRNSSLVAKSWIESLETPAFLPYV